MRLAWVGIVLAVIGCGKHRVDERADVPAWDPPTAANGFRPVVSECAVVIANKLQTTHAGSLEEIVRPSEVRAMTSDGRALYWADSALIHRTERGSTWSEPWSDTIIVGAQNAVITNLAVTNRFVYWTTFESVNEQTLFQLEPATGKVTKVLVDDIGRLVSRHDAVMWMTQKELVTLSDSGSQMSNPLVLPSLNRLFAADGAGAIVFNRESFFIRTTGPWSMTTTLAAAVNPVDAFSDGTWLYWLERGAPGPDEKDCLSNAYQSSRPSFPNGKLRRVSLHGGPTSDVFVGIPEAQSLTVVRGILWITSGDGLLRYDPSCHLPPVKVAAGAGVQGRAAVLGDALAVAIPGAPGERARIALLASP